MPPDAAFLPELPFGEGLMAPDYAGGSILNLPSTICTWLGIPGLGADALKESLTAPLGGVFRRVILIVMDALADHRLVRWIDSGRSSPAWQQLRAAGLLASLTSISPSTTSAALTSLWTGCSPRQHAIAGYELLLKEYGIVANTIQHKPIAFQGDAGALERAGFKPEDALACSSLGTHLAAHGVKSYAFQHLSIARSGLTRMLLKDVQIESFFTASDLWVNLAG